MSELTAKTIEDSLNEHFQNKILGVETHYDFLTITVSLDTIKDVIQFLYDDPTMNFKYLTTCCGLHFPDAPLKFCMMYQVHNLESNFRLRLKAYTNAEPPTFPTLIDIFKAANWMEREAYDFFGFRFTGNSDIRRILNMDDLEGWPLRKEFPLEDPFRKDKDDSMFGR